MSSVCCQLGQVPTWGLCGDSSSFSDGEIKRFGRETELTGRLLPHGLVTLDLELVQDGGQQERGHVLHHFVAHALSLAHREWLKMLGLFEGVVFLDESVGIVSLGFVPVVLAEIRVVVVDEDDGVGLHFVPFLITKSLAQKLIYLSTLPQPAMEVFLLATWGTMALQV